MFAIDVNGGERKGRTTSLGLCATKSLARRQLQEEGRNPGSGPLDHEMVAGVRFELTTFGLCDLTQLSLRVGLYLHPA